MNPYLKWLLFWLTITGAGKSAVSQTYIFAQLTGTPMNTTGWNLSGDAHVTNITGSADSELMICRAAQIDNGAAFFAQPINLAFCNKWIAEFDFRLFDGTGADGLAFCFLDVPPSAFVNGSGLGIPDVANGLKVCFDTWNNCIPYDSSTVHNQMPKIEIRYGKGYDECLGQPTFDNPTGEISYIRGPNYNRAKIVYDTGQVSVYVNDTLYLSSYQPHLYNFTGYLGFTASTGGYTDNESIKNVIIYTQMPVPYAGNAQAFCPYDTVRLGGPVNPSYIYAWSPSAGLSDTTSSAPLVHLSNDSSNSVLYKYYVKTAFADNPGCTSLDSVTVKVYPNPIVNFTMPKICLSDAIGQFYDSSYTQDGETLPFSYKWNFADPNASAPGNPDNSSLQNPTHRYSAAANYNMNLTVTNAMGCIDSAGKVFTVNGTVPQAVFDVLNSTQLCSNGVVELENISTVNFGSVVAVQIDWGDTAGVSYMDSLPNSGKTYSHNYPNPVTTSTANYTIKLIASSGLTCKNESDQPISVAPAPHVQFGAMPKLCDIDTAVAITEASELTGLGGTAAYYGKGATTAGVLDPLRAGAGTDSLLYVYKASNGCSDSAAQTVWIQSLPRVRAGDDTAVVVNQPLQLRAVSSDGELDAFHWSPADGLDNPEIADPIAMLWDGIDSIRYYVTAMDSLGCVGQATLKVLVFRSGPDLFVPNAFTPGRSANRLFRPIPVGISSLHYFRVYNRHGELVYGTSQLEDGWDGTIGGMPQPAGVYVWTAEGKAYTGKVIAKNGTVILVR